MKRNLWFSFVVSLVVCMLSSGAIAQKPEPTNSLQSIAIPLRGTTPAQAYRESLEAMTLPMWSDTIKSPIDNNVYTYTLLGRKYGTPGPNIPGVTSIPTYIIPLRVELLDTDGKTVVMAFDPSQADQACLNTPLTPTQIVGNSPLFNDSNYTWGGTNLGTTQYIDAQLRAEFWKVVQTSPLPWHNKFQGYVLASQTVQVPFVNWTWGGKKDCSKYAQVNFNWLDNYIMNTVIPTANITTTQLPIILTYNVLQGGAGGYHSGFGSPAQIYGVSAYLSSTKDFLARAPDIDLLAHELGEVMNNPLVFQAPFQSNTPAWGNIGQVPLCQSNFEVGDPLTPVQMPVITLNGFDYHPQELAFISWFYRSPNWGVNGWYSTNDSLVLDAGDLCNSAGPVVASSPSSGPVDTMVNVFMVRLPPNTAVTVFFNGQQVATLTTKANGTGTTSFKVPKPQIPSEKQILAVWNTGMTFSWFIVTQ